MSENKPTANIPAPTLGELLEFNTVPEGSYEQLDDLRGTGAIRATSGEVTVRLCVDRRWYDDKNRIVPLDAHGPWTITKRHKDGM